MAGRLLLIEEYVDRHVWGHLLDVFLDTFPHEAGLAAREIMAKGKPIVSMRRVFTERERVPMLIADDPQHYADIVSRLIEDRDFYAAACAATRDFVAAQPGEAEYAAAVDAALTTVVRRVRSENPSPHGSQAGLPDPCRHHSTSGLSAIALDQLVCARVLDRLRDECPRSIDIVDFAQGGRPIEVGAARDVLYLPELHLQIWRDGIIPYEVNADDDAIQEGSIHSGAVVRSGVSLIDASDQDVCILSNLYSHNFAHFFEELYKVVILERQGFSGVFSPFPTRIAKTLPTFSTQFLEFLGIPRERILHVDVPTVFRT